MVVTSFEPLEIWLFEEYYVRLCADDYEKGKDHKGELYMSLANNSISKYAETKKKGHENMLFKQEFDEYLKVIISNFRKSAEKKEHQ